MLRNRLEADRPTSGSGTSSYTNNRQLTCWARVVRWPQDTPASKDIDVCQCGPCRNCADYVSARAKRSLQTDIFSSSLDWPRSRSQLLIWLPRIINAKCVGNSGLYKSICPACINCTAWPEFLVGTGMNRAKSVPCGRINICNSFSPLIPSCNHHAARTHGRHAKRPSARGMRLNIQNNT